jgi:hypothetical protein
MESSKPESLKQREHREAYVQYKDTKGVAPPTTATPNNTPDTTGKPPLAPLLKIYSSTKR